MLSRTRRKRRTGGGSRDRRAIEVIDTLGVALTSLEGLMRVVGRHLGFGTVSSFLGRR